MPDQLIQQLQREHQLIASLLTEAKQKGVDSKAGRQALVKAKNALLAHLRTEDEQLYPPLREAAKKDRRLAWMLELYARDMDEVSSAAIAFFNKYGDEKGEGLDFARDFGSLFARLKVRISNEESELYGEFIGLMNPQRKKTEESSVGLLATAQRG